MTPFQKACSGSHSGIIPPSRQIVKKSSLGRTLSKTNGPLVGLICLRLQPSQSTNLQVASATLVFVFVTAEGAVSCDCSGIHTFANRGSGAGEKNAHPSFWPIGLLAVPPAPSMSMMGQLKGGSARIKNAHSGNFPVLVQGDNTEIGGERGDPRRPQTMLG